MFGRHLRLPISPRRGFTLVELLVVIAIIGALVALLLPAVQGGRESARRTQCKNNLRQIGLALLAHHDEHGALPMGCLEWRPYGGTTERQLAWSVYLLPYLEQEPLYNALDLSQGFDAPANADAAQQQVATYLCPSSRRNELVTSTRGRSDYGGMYGERINGPNNPPKGTMLIDELVRLRHVTDGASHTIAVVEDAQFPDGEWINGRNILDQAFPINTAPPFENDIRSEHPGGAQVVLLDASVHFLSESIDLKLLAALCTRAGGEIVDAF